MAKHNEIGKIGEDIATKWYEQRNFTIISRNYRKKWGEIDIVARETTGSIHFIEVKTVSYETKQELEHAVSYGTYNPADNVHTDKKRRLANIIETWISENKYSGRWQIDVVVVRLVPHEKYSSVKILENVIFE